MKAAAKDRASQLQMLWAQRSAIQTYNARQTQLNLETMPIGVKVWFNVAAAQIVNAWNDGALSLAGTDLQQRSRGSFVDVRDAKSKAGSLDATDRGTRQTDTTRSSGVLTQL